MKLSTQIKSAVTQLANAQEAEAFKGCGDPADYPEIERRLSLCRERFNKLMQEVDKLEAYHCHATS